MSVWAPDDRQRDKIRQYAKIGMSIPEIVQLLNCGITERVLLLACRPEIELGHTEAKVSLRVKLFAEAAAGKAPALLHLVREHAEDATIVDTTALGSWLCCTRETISDLERRGIIEKSARGKWDLKQCVQRYTTHMRAVAAGRSSGDGSGLDLSAERARLARAQSESCEMENEVTRGNLLAAEDVRDEVGRLVKIFVRSISTVADRLERDMRVAPDVVAYVDGVMTALRDEIAGAVAE